MEEGERRHSRHSQDGVDPLVDEADVEPARVDPAKARREVIKILRQSDKVVSGIANRKSAISDDELVKRLALADNLASTLRQVGMKDLESVAKVCELLPYAVQAKGTKKVMGCPRGIHATVLCCPVILGLAFPAFYEFVVLAMQWTDGQCKITGFTNGTCVREGRCYLNIQITTKVDDQVSILAMTGWQPVVEPDPADPSATRYVGDAFRCCSPGHGKLDCCAWIDPVTLYFCDDWAHRVDHDGVKCQSGSWDCRFRSETGTVGGNSKPTVTELVPYVGTHASVYITLALSLVGLAILLIHLCCVVFSFQIRAQRMAVVNYMQKAHEEAEKQAREAEEKWKEQIAKQNAAAYEDEDPDSIRPIPSDEYEDDDEGMERLGDSMVESGVANRVGIELSQEEAAERERRTAEEEAAADEALNKWTTVGTRSAPKPRESLTENTDEEDYVAKGLPNTTSRPVSGRSRKTTTVSSRSSSRPHSAISSPLSGSPKRSRQKRRENVPDEDCSSAGIVLGISQAKAQAASPGLAKDQDKYLLGDVFKAMDEDLNGHIKHYESLRSPSNNTIKAIFANMEDLKGQTLIPGRKGSERELRLKAHTEHDGQWSQQLLGQMSPTTTSPTRSRKPSRQINGLDDPQLPKEPTSPTPSSPSSPVRYEALAKLGLLFPEGDKVSRATSSPASQRLAEVSSTPSSPLRRSSLASPSRAYRPPTPEDPPPGMWTPSPMSTYQSQVLGGGLASPSRASEGTSTAQGRGAAFAAAAVRSNVIGMDFEYLPGTPGGILERCRKSAVSTPTGRTSSRAASRGNVGAH